MAKPLLEENMPIYYIYSEWAVWLHNGMGGFNLPALIDLLKINKDEIPSKYHKRIINLIGVICKASLIAKNIDEEDK